MQPLDVHHFQAHGLAADVARLETLGLGDSVGDDVDADLFEVVVDGLQRLSERAHVAGLVEPLSHPALGALSQKTKATLGGLLGFRVRDR